MLEAKIVYAGQGGCCKSNENTDIALFVAGTIGASIRLVNLCGTHALLTGLIGLPRSWLLWPLAP